MAEYISSPCAECIQKQEGCCNGKDRRIPLTINDIGRIKNKTGKIIEDFVRLKKYDLKGIEDDEEWWKESVVWINGLGYKPGLAKNKNENCAFLVEGKGCSLGDDRPTICKMYPFWVNETGEMCFQEEGFCYGEVQAKRTGIPLPILANSFNESEEKIRGYFEEIKEDFTFNRDKHSALVERLYDSAV